jgi:hypothetical protein
MAQGKRFKWQGSSVQIQTGFSATKAVTGISKANPGVVTATAHGILDGQVFRVAGVTGMTEVNDALYVASGVTANTVALTDTNTTNYATYVSGGTLAPATYSDFCELTGFDQEDGTAEEIDVTTICSTSKEFEVGLADSGSVTLSYNYAGAETAQAALRAAKLSGETISLIVTLPKSGGRLVMFGVVQSQSLNGGNGGVWTGSAQIKLSGKLYALANLAA